MSLSKGFTLVEVLAVGFIVGILSTIILLNYRTGQNQASLTRAAVAFETEIRKAQNLTVGSAEFGGVVPCGYGIHYIDNRTFFIYAGVLGGAANCQSSNHNFQSGIDLVYQNIKIIESAVIFTQSGFVDIFFQPPDPATFINDSNAIGITATIGLCLETDLTKCRSLIIDTAGRIVIQ